MFVCDSDGAASFLEIRNNFFFSSMRQYATELMYFQQLSLNILFFYMFLFIEFLMIQFQLGRTLLQQFFYIDA